jgi:hypothetical protein
MKVCFADFTLPLSGGAAFLVTLLVLSVRSPQEARGVSDRSGRDTAAVAAPTAAASQPAARQPVTADLLAAPQSASAQSTAAAGAAVRSAAIPPSQTQVDQLVDLSWGDDASRRAEAIAALGHVPRDLALPALKRIVKSGEPRVDRHIALEALHVLAVDQGDDDGAIRTLLRELIYDGNDPDVTEDARGVLDRVEAPRQ